MFRIMKLKEWNSLSKSDRKRIASVVFALDGFDKIEDMSLIWRHNVDDDHRKLLKAASIKDDKFKIIVTI